MTRNDAILAAKKALIETGFSIQMGLYSLNARKGRFVRYVKACSGGDYKVEGKTADDGKTADSLDSLVSHIKAAYLKEKL